MILRNKTKMFVQHPESPYIGVRPYRETKVSETCQYDKTKFEKVEHGKVEYKEKSIEWTYSKLKSLNEEDQTKMLNDLGETKIPKTEDGRINKILKLIGEQ